MTTAKRLAEWLGPEVIGGSSLACNFLITVKPYGEKITGRAIPIEIFKEEPEVQLHFLRRWLKDGSLPPDFDIRNLLGC